MANESETWLKPAKRIVTERWGESVTFGDADLLGGSDRSNVHRVKLEAVNPSVPNTVVVKQAGQHGDQVYDPDSKEGPAYGLLNDWAGLAFLAELDSGTWPDFYGGDRETGIILLEDLGAARQIDHILLGDDPVEARETMCGYVRALADLNRTTAGHANRYDEIRRELGPRTIRNYVGRIRQFGEMMKERGFDSEALSSELERCADVLADPGPFRVYTHGDSCPDNCLLTDGQVYLIDFEWGEIRHALIDGVYPWIHFPSCWCVNKLPDDLTDLLLEEYRSRLALGIPEAEDDRLFGGGLVAASVAGFNVNFFADDVFVKDHRWGIATLRQRLRIRIIAKTAEQYGYPALATACARLGDRFDEIWSDVELMPIYPDFRS